jgi:hypothetical protein
MDTDLSTTELSNMKIVRFRTTASMVNGPFSTRDALLTAMSPAQSAANARRVAEEVMQADLGAIWAGVMQSPNAAESFDALPADIKSQLLEKYGQKAQQLAAYVKVSGASTLESTGLVTISDRRSKARDGGELARATRDTIRGMNDAARRLWSGRQQTAVAASPATLQGINEANARFWVEQNVRR